MGITHYAVKFQLLPDSFHPLHGCSRSAAALLLHSEPISGSRPPFSSARQEGDKFSSNERQALLSCLLVNVVWASTSPFPFILVSKTLTQLVGSARLQCSPNRLNEPPLALQNGKCQLQPDATQFGAILDIVFECYFIEDLLTAVVSSNTVAYCACKSTLGCTGQEVHSVIACDRRAL